MPTESRADESNGMRVEDEDQEYGFEEDEDHPDPLMNAVYYVCLSTQDCSNANDFEANIRSHEAKISNHGNTRTFVYALRHYSRPTTNLPGALSVVKDGMSALADWVEQKRPISSFSFVSGRQ